MRRDPSINNRRKRLFSYSDYLDQRKDGGTTTAIVLGSMGGFVALLGFFTIFKGAKAKAK